MEQENFQDAYIIVKDALGMRSGAMRNKAIFRVQLLWRFYFLKKLQDPRHDYKELKEKALNETMLLGDKQQNIIKELLEKLSGQFEKKKMTAEAQSLEQLAAFIPRHGN